MDLTIKAIILGIIEGLTEFLPVSSTGHLILANGYLDFTGEFANLFAVFIQIGAILAVIIYFREKIFPRSLDKYGIRDFTSLWMRVVVGCIPAALIGIPLEGVIEKYLFTPKVVAGALIFGAFLLMYSDKRKHNISVTSERAISYKQAFAVGVFQCMALIPGMSRSASTIMGGLFMGFDRKTAAEFSFFLALPTIIGAGLLKLIKADFIITSQEWMLLGIGTLVSFIVAYVVIALFMNYIKKKPLTPFAIYRIVLGIIVFLLVK
ncbi:MAG: undecaprenyl-diphosphate phosphatase [Firmicutes bacterium]|jgi:undecaprenyl-diphosphatase|nr:undecaprenyl-diphosphate phosphatase [Bacillota bacterium]